VTDEAMTPFDRLQERAERLTTGPVVRAVAVPMSDGVELAADVYLPDSAVLPVPAIVEVTPYDKSDSLLMVEEARFYQRNGYAFVAVDVRGRGRSEGEWTAFVHDGADTFDVVEWAADQTWCDGNIGTTGISYMGWAQWAAAIRRPPHLRAMVSTSAAGRWQQEIPYTNGVLQLYFAWWTWRTRRRLSVSRDDAQPDWDKLLRTLPFDDLGAALDMDGPTWRMLMDHDTLDDHWRSLRFDGRYDEIDVPCLHVTGWHDLEDLAGAFHHYEEMIASSPAASRQRLLVGPWSHLKSRVPDTRYAGNDLGSHAAVDMDAVHLRWFDHWLRGVQNGVEREAPVRIFEGGSRRWRELPRWPGVDGELSLALSRGTGDGALTEQHDDAVSSRTFRYDPEDPCPTPIDVGRYPFEDVPLDQTAIEARPDVLTYTSAPLDRAVVVSGWPYLKLFASTDCDDTDWHVKLTDVDPDGRSVKVTQGCLRAACRDSLETPRPLVAGTVHRFVVELWPTRHAFLVGHRIRVSITSSDFPWFARNLNRFGPIAGQSDPRVATNCVHHGAGHPSALRLPVVDAETRVPA
jgi:putative CocE/NonD family hydrolase